MDPNRLANVGTPDFDGRPREMVSARGGGGHRFWLGHMVSTSSTAVVVNVGTPDFDGRPRQMVSARGGASFLVGRHGVYV